MAKTIPIRANRNFIARVKGKIFRPINPNRLDLDMMKGKNEKRYDSTGCYGIKTTWKAYVETYGPKTGRRREPKRLKKGHHMPSSQELQREEFYLSALAEAYRQSIVLQMAKRLDSPTFHLIENLAKDFLGLSRFAEVQGKAIQRAKSILGRYGADSLNPEQIRRTNHLIKMILTTKPTKRTFQEGMEHKAQPSTFFFCD